MLFRFVTALCALVVLLSGARAQEAITVNNFGHLLRYNSFAKDLVPEPFSCKSGAVVVLCESSVRSRNVKADIITRGDPASGVMTKVGVSVEHPKMARSRIDGKRISIIMKSARSLHALARRRDEPMPLA